MERTLTRQQIGVFLATMSNEAITEGEAKLKEIIGEENFNTMKNLENQVFKELAEGKTEITVDVPDEILELLYANQPEEEEDEDGEEQ